MNKANHKPVSESARVLDEKTSKCKASARIKLSSDNLMYPLYLEFKCLVDVIRLSGKFCMVDTALAVFFFYCCSNTFVSIFTPPQG